MRIANLSGRLALIDRAGAVALDVERASDARFGPDPQGIYDDWTEFVGWAAGVDPSAGQPFRVEDLGPPAPAPRQVLAIGLNYSDHAAEAGLAEPTAVNVLFTKWPSCLTGPVSAVELPEGGRVDWEVELVVVIGRYTHRVPEDRAWSSVAGLTVGQDLSERILQTAGPAPQYSLGKSLPGFGPIGPWLVTPDEVEDRDDLEIGCLVNGEQVQKSRTSNLIFSVPSMIAQVSATLPLLPGDVLFTGTPGGVGVARTPPRRLAPGDELVSYVSGIGQLRQRFVAAIS
ncbi:fumarylacetoacetate hydrolase family protein [Cryptosporangium sp. NPDC051539]|uniref:fumarylacetoacetate hydrolase family protein n=1 Tax=Cryptosporangium sp. NPDC051539 TaxID=3363962 RepID=UPI0037A4D209